MNDTGISLLYNRGCPLAPRVRRNLRRAIEKLGHGQPLGFQEFVLQEAGTPEHLKGWGSPTILIDGAELTGAAQGDAASCRLYPGRERVPTVDEIVQALARDDLR